MSDAFPTDVIVEVLASLDVESVLQVGCSNTSLRKTTLLERVWTPRLATCGLGRFPLDAEALAELVRLGGDARCICLQCLPWRPRRGAASGADDDSDMWQTSWSWRPDWMPKQLYIEGCDFFFVEVYETNFDNSSADGRRPTDVRVALPEVPHSQTFIKRHIATKVIPLGRALVSNFPEEVYVPLKVDLPGDDIGDRVFDVRVFMLRDLILAPLADTCCMEGEGNSRSHESRRFADNDRRLDVSCDMDINVPNQQINSLSLRWNLFKNLKDDDSDEEEWDELEHHNLGGLCDFHHYNASRILSTLEDGHAHRYSFACDYERDSRNPALFDFSRKKPPRDRSAVGHTHNTFRAAEAEVQLAQAALDAARAKLDDAHCRAHRWL